MAVSKAQTFDTLDRDARQRSVQAIFDQADIRLVLWPDGQVIDAVFGGDFRAAAPLADHVAEDLVIAEDSVALGTLISEARAGRSCKPVNLHHSALIRSATAACYTAHLAGDGQRIVMIGSWRTPRLSLVEQAVTAEIALTEAPSVDEARYRLLFEGRSEGLLFVDPLTNEVEEANSRAATLLGVSKGSLTGSTLEDLFGPDADIAAIMETGGPLVGTGRVLGGPARTLIVHPQPVRLDGRELLLLRLTPRPIRGQALPGPIALLRQLADPVVLTDSAGIAVWANPAFATHARDGFVPGQPVAEALGLPGYALDLVLREADRSGRAVSLMDALDTRANHASGTHLTVLSVPRHEAIGYGIVISAERPLETANDTGTRDDVADLVGEITMKDMVSQTAGLIERQCIEAALRLTGNNRAATAQVLGVSRQGLYLKLRQYGLL